MKMREDKKKPYRSQNQIWEITMLQCLFPTNQSLMIWLDFLQLPSLVGALFLATTRIRARYSWCTETNTMTAEPCLRQRRNIKLRCSAIRRPRPRSTRSWKRRESSTDRAVAAVVQIQPMGLPEATIVSLTGAIPESAFFSRVQ